MLLNIKEDISIITSSLSRSLIKGKLRSESPTHRLLLPSLLEPNPHQCQRSTGTSGEIPHRRVQVEPRGGEPSKTQKTRVTLIG